MTIEQFEMTKRNLWAFNEFCKNHECSSCKVPIKAKKGTSCFEKYSWLKDNNLLKEN